MSVSAARRGSLLLLCAGWAAVVPSCATTSASASRELELGNSMVAVSAYVDRGAVRDEIVILLDGEEVASGTFDATTSPVLVLEFDHDGTRVEVACGHRWRPGLHIGYRCRVGGEGGASVALEF